MRWNGKQSSEADTATRILTLLATLMGVAPEALAQEPQVSSPTAYQSSVPVGAPLMERRIVVKIGRAHV